MILIKEDYKKNIISYIFRNQNKIDYTGAYYKDKEAEKQDRRSYFRHIYHISVKHGGGVEISGTIGTRLFLFCTIKQAIAEYNKMAKGGKSGR